MSLLTWPQNMNGKRNVSPFHIHDWNPSEKKRVVFANTQFFTHIYAFALLFFQNLAGVTYIYSTRGMLEYTYDTGQI